MRPHVYETPQAFKVALEQRLRNVSRSGADFSRRRQLLVFDRFLARVSESFGDAVMLKGGLALELRIECARTTRDVDLRMLGPSDTAVERLREAARLELGDFLHFEVAADAHHPEIQNEGMKYEGLRFRAECKLAGKPFGTPFGVDVVFGDPVFGEPTLVRGEDVLGFSGVPPSTLRLCPIETHIAEKLHAYTMPRKRPNSRVKDLPDPALLATAQPIAADRLKAAFVQTFEFRGTHPVPGVLPAPPENWRPHYRDMAQENLLRWETLEAVTSAARAFLDPALAGNLRATWHPERWEWCEIRG
jgi:hypothetical protein